MEALFSRIEVIVFLNGNVPDLQQFKRFLDNKVLIAADGAAEQVARQNVTLDYVVGDLDSVSTNIHNIAAKIVKIDNQDKTDFEKTLDFVNEKKLGKVLVLGIDGKELDHCLVNMMTMCNHKLGQVSFISVYDYNIKYGVVLRKDEQWQYHLPLGSKISILPCPTAKVTSVGLNWELKNTELDQNSFSARNHNILEKVVIDVHEGQVLVISDICNKKG